MAGKKQTITVLSNEENPEPIEVIAQAIIEVSQAFQRINNSRLKRRAVLLMLQDLTKLSMRDIEKVLDVAPKLESHFIKELPKKKQ